MQTRHFAVRSAVVAAAIVLMSVAFGCGEETAADPVEDDSSVLITPEIRIAGLDQLDDGVYLEDLYLGIGEIRLEPVDDPMGVVYVTREPLFLHFDLGAGQWALSGEPMLLPQGGQYMVTLHMGAVDDGQTTMRVDGLMADPGDDHGFLSANAIEPTPLPMRTVQGGLHGRTDAEQPRVAWVPWTYSTSRKVNVALNDVIFESDQTLVINFDVSAWIGDVIEPISAEVSSQVEARGTLPGVDGWPEGAAALDVSKIVDASEGGLEHLDVWSEAFSG